MPKIVVDVPEGYEDIGELLKDYVKEITAATPDTRGGRAVDFAKFERAAEERGEVGARDVAEVASIPRYRRGASLDRGERARQSRALQGDVLDPSWSGRGRAVDLPGCRGEKWQDGRSGELACGDAGRRLAAERGTSNGAPDAARNFARGGGDGPAAGRLPYSRSSF